MNRISTIAVVAAIAAPALSIADGVVDLTVYPNQIIAEVAFAAGVAVDVTLDFESAHGLSLSSIGLNAELVLPNDASLLARLPSLVSIPSAFPLLLSIEPPPTGNLSFTGLVTVSLHTHNLGYSVGSPFRLYVAEDGGQFMDITDRAGSGSYRVRGSQGDFSEFMILADLRPSNAVISEKFGRLAMVLGSNESAIDPAVHDNLSFLLATARSAFLAGNNVLAIQSIDDFIAESRANAGGAVPNLWRARDDLVNIDGQLRAEASTLRYSLTLHANDLP